MAISDKLTYLNTTKGKIKDSINLTGAGITNEDTFRSYATKLRDGLVQVLNDNGETLYNNFPKVSGTGSNISLSNTLEAPMFMNKFDGDTLQNGTPTPDTPVEIQCVEGIQNITIDDGNGNSQTQEVNLGTIKLYNGDYITGTPDNWSIVRNNGRVVLNGSEDWTYYQNNIFYTYIYNYPEILKSSAINCISDSYKCLISTSTASEFENLSANYDYTMNLHTTIELIRIKDTRFTTSQQLKTALTNNNVEVVYKLATPTTTPITDTNLISQLNNVYNLKSYDDTTNISTSGNLPMILEVSALKDEI